MTVFGKITLRNYRCFDWDNPAELEFGDGFTALVGPNNVGKSSVLRSVYELRSFFGSLFTTVSPNHGFNLSVAPIGVADLEELANENDPTKIQITIEILKFDLPLQIGFLVATYLQMEYDVKTQNLKSLQFRALDLHGYSETFSFNDIRNGQYVGELSVRYDAKNGTIVDFSKIHEFGLDLAHSKYFPAFRNAINEGASIYYDIPVGTALVSNWNGWKAGSVKSQQRAISQVEHEIAELLGFKTLEINADASVKNLNVIINNRPQRLNELGAGVAQLIIVLASALIYKPPYLLIDEPELSLHPSLQLNFLSTLASYVKNGIIFSTHSIGLARSSAQRIYSVQKIKDGVSKMSAFGSKSVHYSEWLGELSYSERSELGCEGLLLVEGPTEVLLFQELLRKVNKDHKFVIMNLGGSNLINARIASQLAELTRIIDTSKINVFIDSEKKSAEDAIDKDRAAFLSECHKLGVNAVASELRAIENYFEITGIQLALDDKYVALEPFQKLEESPKPWSKSNNWKIARHTDINKIIHTDLGKFLDSL